MTGCPSGTAAPVESTRAGPAVSVVICAHDTARAPLLNRCLDSVLAELRGGDEVIVVVDHNDALLQTVAARCGRAATVVPNRGPRGLSAARNSGVEVARGQIVAFVDDDAAVLTGWLHLLRGHYTDPAVTAVGGRAQPLWPGRRPPWFPEEFDWVVGCSHRGLPDAVGPVRNVLGCTMSFRREALHRVGGFDTRVGRVGATAGAGEETEVCIRLRQQSPRSLILLDPDVVVRHTVSAHRATLQYFVRRCYAEGVAKSVVSDLVGAGDALSTERRYVTRVLPAALLRYLRTAQFGRAGALLLGLGATVTGYALARCGAVGGR